MLLTWLRMKTGGGKREIDTLGPRDIDIYIAVGEKKETMGRGKRNERRGINHM